MNEQSADPMQEVYKLSEELKIPVNPAWIIESREMGQLAADSKARELDLMEASKGKFASVVGRFNQVYPKFLESLLGAGEILLTFTYTVLIAFVLPIVLAIAVWTEQGRVFNGIILVDGHDTLASAVAWVFVISNLLAMLIIQWDKQRIKQEKDNKSQESGQGDEQGEKFSLRLVWRWIIYTLGFGKGWRGRQNSPSAWAHRLLFIVSATILMLAVSGNMSEVLKLTDNEAWYVALGNIWSKSDLHQMLNLTNGITLSVALVLIVHGLGKYLSGQFTAIVAAMGAKAGSDRDALIAQSAVLAGVSHLTAKLKETRQTQNRALRGATSAADMPIIRNDASGVIPISVLSYQAKTSQPDGTSQDKSTGRDKPRQVNRTGQAKTGGQIERAITFYRADPSLLNWKFRDLEDNYPSTDAPSGVSRSSWNTARQRYLMEQNQSDQ